MEYENLPQGSTIETNGVPHLCLAFHNCTSLAGPLTENKKGQFQYFSSDIDHDSFPSGFAESTAPFCWIGRKVDPGKALAAMAVGGNVRYWTNNGKLYESYTEGDNHSYEGEARTMTLWKKRSSQNSQAAVCP